MKLLPILSLATGSLGVAVSLVSAPKPWTIVISGDFKGYLSPCGCSFPMIGGIKRRASAVRGLSQRSSLIMLDNGGLVKGTTRQDEIKAETLAEALSLMGIDAINLGAEEARLGGEVLSSIHRLSGNRLVSTQLPSPAPLGILPYVAKGGYLIGGACTKPKPISQALSVKTQSVEQAARRLAAEAVKRNLKPILLLRGSRDDAESAASKVPQLTVIVYSGGGDPLPKPIKVGKTLILTAGEFGKYLVTLSQGPNGALAYRSDPLSPEFRDDPSVSKAYRAYLERVQDERLLDQWPRVQTDAFAGSAACGKCHRRAYDTWAKSKHSQALVTLERESHDFDPDCVNCHVTGLSSQSGFQTREKTPALANVGCESCHGPSAGHTRSPRDKRPSEDASRCVSCHNVDHSPRFNFEAYWSKIAHR